MDGLPDLRSTGDSRVKEFLPFRSELAARPAATFGSPSVETQRLVDVLVEWTRVTASSRVVGGGRNVGGGRLGGAVRLGGTINDKRAGVGVVAGVGRVVLFRAGATGALVREASEVVSQTRVVLGVQLGGIGIYHGETLCLCSSQTVGTTQWQTAGKARRVLR